MKNFEVYEDKIKEYDYDFAAKNGEVIKCYGTCKSCDFGINNSGNCKYNQIKWLYEEYKKPKIKISLATKYFLESLNEKYKWIAKDKNNSAWCYENKPEKCTQDENKRWTVYGRGNITGFRDVLKKELFDFLSWEDEEPTNIKELLENCEVIEDD